MIVLLGLVEFGLGYAVDYYEDGGDEGDGVETVGLVDVELVVGEHFCA